ncbi:helix-turn-helix domain-containing protein [Variovorax soli]|uniref:helix-turn-helix domain-containing protein n=2 Tax=Variovorax soli TaxID=376815 RepID=UPI003620524B
MNDAEAFHFSAVRSADAQAHGSGLGDWEQRYEQLSHGPFEGLMEELRLGPVQIFRESTNRAVLQCGESRPGSVSVGFLSQQVPTGWFCGRKLDQGQAIAAFGNQAFELFTGADSTISAVCVDLAMLQERDPPSADGDDGWLRGALRSAVLDQPGAAHHRLGQQLQEALRLAAERPDWLQRAPVVQALADTLADGVLDCLGAARPRPQAAPGAAARRRILLRARDYMAAHAHEPVSVPQLCAAVGASRRTLQYAFEDALGLSPIHYLRLMRLNRVHIELLRGPADDTVGDVAARWGFWHLPRFAAEYRTLFGELPSQTRKRRAGA